MNTNSFSVHIGNGLFVGQIFDVLGGLFLLLIGAAIFYTLLAWRLRGLTVDGEIVGVRQRGPHFHGVYRYVLPNGESREATSIQSYNNTHDFQTGRHVPIQVMADKLDEAREQHAPMLWALAVGTLVSGAWLVYLGATVSRHSPIAWVMLVLTVTFVANWLWSRAKDLFAKMQPVPVPEPLNALPIRPIESPAAFPSGTLRLTSPRSKTRRTGAIFIVLGLAVFALDYWQARGLLELRHGVRTSGQIMELSEGSTGRNSDTFLFPVVQYAGPDGSVIRFHDRTGARPSPFKVGDTVPVRYMPGRPTTAEIDRGLSNWEPLGSLAIMAIMLTGLGIAALRGR
jgi:Protein of unknown function (DUF3592)